MISSAKLQVHALASGSSGNAYLVQAGDTNLLVDAGIGSRLLASHLLKRGVGAHDLKAVLLTHEHTDHSTSAGAMSRRSGAPVVANAATLQALAVRDARPFETCVLASGHDMRFGDLTVRSFSVPHDAVEPVGYLFDYGGHRAMICTDVGSVTRAVQAALCGVQLAVIEANHDIDWLWRGPYTPEMKERVASDTGHLSNVSCGDLLGSRLDTEGPLTIWLAHLSRINNSPSLARRSVSERIRSQTTVPFRLEVALRDSPSLSWVAGAGAVQLAML